MQSHLVFSHDEIQGTNAVFETFKLSPGTYIYKLTNNHRNERGWGKFVVK
jgi:hypothetical protein